MKKLSWLIVLLLFALSAQAQADSGPRRETGEGKSGPVYKGEQAIAGYFVLVSGLEAKSCHAVVPADGTIYSGVVNPYPEEILRFPECQFSKPAVTIQVTNVLIKQRIQSEILRFSAGTYVAGSYFLLDDGREFVTNCVSLSTPVAGVVKSGVVNPSVEEVKTLPLCLFDFSRRQTDEGLSGVVLRGQQVVAGYILLNSGLHASSCKTSSIPEDGVIYSGVVNPYPEEIAKYPACVWVR